MARGKGEGHLAGLGPWNGFEADASPLSTLTQSPSRAAVDTHTPTYPYLLQYTRTHPHAPAQSGSPPPKQVPHTGTHAMQSHHFEGLDKGAEGGWREVGESLQRLGGGLQWHGAPGNGERQRGQGADRGTTPTRTAQHRMRISQNAATHTRQPEISNACKARAKLAQLHLPCQPTKIAPGEMPPFSPHHIHSATPCSISRARHWLPLGASDSGLRLQHCLYVGPWLFRRLRVWKGALSKGGQADHLNRDGALPSMTMTLIVSPSTSTLAVLGGLAVVR